MINVKISVTDKHRLEGSENWNGCLSNMTLLPWSFKAFVPKESFVAPSPFITKFTPGHDWRILSTIDTGERVNIGFQFSSEMNCDSITNSISIKSTAYRNQTAQLDKSTISCGPVAETQMALWPGALTSVYNYSAQLTNVFHGIHEIVVNNASNKDGDSATNVSLIGSDVRMPPINITVTVCRSLHTSNRFHG